MKTTTIRLPESLLKSAKILAVQEGTSLQELIIQGLTQRLASSAKGARK